MSGSFPQASSRRPPAVGSFVSDITSNVVIDILFDKDDFINKKNNLPLDVFITNILSSISSRKMNRNEIERKRFTTQWQKNAPNYTNGIRKHQKKIKIEAL